MFIKKYIFGCFNILLVCILIGVSKATERTVSDKHVGNKKSNNHLGRNKNIDVSFLQGRSFQSNSNRHRSRKGGTGSKSDGTESKSDDDKKKKKGGIMSKVVKPLWDKHKHKLYCKAGKLIGFDGWCQEKVEEEKKEKPKKKKIPPVAKETFSDVSCVTCLYVMEKVERLVTRNPMDGEPSGPNNQNAFPGPASYNPAAYNAAQDINLAAPIPGPGYSSGMFLEVGDKIQTKASRCPPGMPFCRKPLYRTGRRGTERELARMTKISKQKQLGVEIQDGLRSIAGEMPPKYHAIIHKLQVRAEQIGVQYLHEYSNEEICVDLTMCFAANLGTAESKVFKTKSRI